MAPIYSTLCVLAALASLAPSCEAPITGTDLSEKAGTSADLDHQPTAGRCITKKEIKAAQEAWADALVSIGEAWVGESYLEGETSVPEQNCESAKEAAKSPLTQRMHTESRTRCSSRP